MKHNLIFFSIMLVLTVVFSLSAHAQSPACSDLTWDKSVLAKSPMIADRCQEVVERDGAWYAKMHVKVVRQSAGSTVVQYQGADGSWGEPESFDAPMGFTASVGGKDVKMSDMRDGQELNVYVLQEGNFAIPGS